MHGKWKSTRENGKTKFKCIIRVNINVNSLKNRDSQIGLKFCCILFTGHMPKTKQPKN